MSYKVLNHNYIKQHSPETPESATIVLTLEDLAQLRELLYEMLDTYQSGDEYDKVKELLAKL